MQIKTWMIESFVVALILSCSFLIKTVTVSEIVCAIAVWLTFMHAQIADRMSEKQAKMETPDVPCYKKSVYYFISKELMWIIFFVMIHSYAAIIGCATFILYPIWRKYYNKHLRTLKQ